MSEDTARGYPPKIIWMLWLQGWDQAPEVARIARRNWARCNPGWKLQALDRTSLAHFLPADILEKIFCISKPAEALSDQIRLELLHRYGGVWADATTICARPLNDWLAQAMPHGFFAFSSPGPDRMISTWFLAAEKGSRIVEHWRAASWAYWQGRQDRDSYFWVHELFAAIHAQDAGVRALWGATPAISARNSFHFGPEADSLKQKPAPEIEADLADPPVPVFKLTHKFATPLGPESLFARLCAFAEAVAGDMPQQPKVSARILVGWYGSFAGHGTVGDLRSLEAVVSHLVGLGFEVMHATAQPLTIAGAVRVDWTQIAQNSSDIVLFVCGPILKQHPQTRSFFARFQGLRLVGVGVSLMPDSHENYLDPFDKVFARQGTTERFGDVAISAPLPVPDTNPAEPNAVPVIGLALRGPQQEYGISLCLANEAKARFDALTNLLAQHGSLRVVTLENHLARSGQAPEAIEAAYRECDLVLTTRFHGAIIALRQGVPFIAIDQISGGAKVLPLLEDLGWPALFDVSASTAIDIIHRGLDLLAADQTLILCQTQDRAVRNANRTLCHLGDWLLSHDPAWMARGPQTGHGT